MKTPLELKQEFLRGVSLVNTKVLLNFPNVVYVIRSNSNTLLNIIARYFKDIVIDNVLLQSNESLEPIEIVLIESDSPSLSYEFKDWKREPGKTGRKDAICDFDQARVILKVRTGMTFLQSQQYRVATGKCVENDNQIVNFIINQYMNLLQQQGWLICHAAALSNNNGAIAFSGFSGGGKSTAMLHLMSESQYKFVSNDRLFIRRGNNAIEVRGVPKMPRINPGTILNNPKLKPMLTGSELTEFESLPVQELWELEKKYDVDVSLVYGKIVSIMSLTWRIS